MNFITNSPPCEGYYKRLNICYNVINGDALEQTHMAQSLEEYVAQATKAYQPAQTALQTQLDALAGKLDTANQAINKNYAQQQATLNRNRNSAAETASMQAAGSGGSFGGAANIANRKYYEQSFVPAQTQLQTNQANELAQARQNSENERTSLNSQIANLQSQANQQALQQYWAEVEAERERENQRKLAAQQAAQQDAYYQYLMDAMKAENNAKSSLNKQNVDFTTWVKNYSGYSNSLKNKLLNSINTAQKQASNKGLVSRIASNAFANSLEKSQYYKQYQNWRNS